MDLFSLKKEREDALAACESVVSTAEAAKRAMTPHEDRQYNAHMAAIKSLNSQISAIEKKNTIMQHVQDGKLIPAVAGLHNESEKPQRKFLSAEYLEAFREFISSGGKKISAALYEGSDLAGGYAVPIVVDSQIVPLAPAEIGVEAIASVLPTSSDIKVPIKSAFGSGIAIKTESGSSTHLFAESDPSLGEFTLSAFMLGGVATMSFELAQDVQLFQKFAVDDLLTSIAVFKDGKYVSGSGTNEPQGLLGNVGAGVTGVAADGSGNLLPNTALFDVTGTLNAVYHPGASWLMSRATGTTLKKQQMSSNLFAPLWTQVGGRDYLLGYPVQYSAAMPSIAAGNTPVLFGDFKAGYLIGVRGGAGVNVKILDQPLATSGQIQLLAYQRVDGRVRRSEAIQGITLHT